MARRRGAVAAELAREAGEAVAQFVDAEPAVRSASRVALHVASGREIPTRALFERLRGSERLLPRVRGDHLEWVRLEDWGSLAPGRFGIPEPVGEAVDPPALGDVVLLPGLAFDPRGVRLGRGAGYYDRAFPPGGRSPLLVGIAYAFQVVDTVPHDSRDRRVDAIVTERGWAWCREAG